MRVIRISIAINCTASAAAGSSICSRFPNGSMVGGIHDTGGTQLKTSDVNNSVRVASQKLGIDRPIRPAIRPAKSAPVSRRLPV